MVSLQPSISPQSSAKPEHGLPVAQLKRLNQRSDRQGWLRLGGHLAIMAISGILWGMQRHHLWIGLWIGLPALVIYGFSFAAMFAPLHECGHRTAFASPQMNRWVEWLAGFLSFYNSDFYRRYHKWHHRYTQIPGKDPELSDPPPETWRDYLWALSGIGWWWGKVSTHLQVALGHVDDLEFIPSESRATVIRSTRLQLLAYLGVIGVSTALGHPGFIGIYWLLPLAMGQPILRFILLAEHTGCSNESNPFSNTRTTLTLWPLRFLMWNMPFHTEHHRYPSIPFHALPTAHDQLLSQLQHVAPGYTAVHRQLVGRW